MLKKNKPAIQLFYTIVFFVLVSIEISAQVSVNSPYSRYGVGDLATRQNGYNFSMGGVALAISNPRYVNPFNPASNTAFDSLSFIFSGGLSSKIGTLKTDQLSTNTNYVTLGYFLFGFPVTKWLKSSIGIIPYSNVGYDIIDKQNLAGIGNTNFLYKGSGGLNQFYVNFGVQLTKNLSVGATASYLFGKANLAKFIYFPDSTGILHTRIDNYIEVGDLTYDFCVQYKKPIGNDLTLGFGAIYAPSQNVSAIENYLARTYSGSSTGVEYFRDTIESRQEHTGVLVIPEKYGFGVMLKKKENWMVGADYSWQNWSKYKAFGVSDSLQNSMQFSIGGEYQPNRNAVTNYWKLVTYRLGFRYNKTYLEVRNTQINEFGISFGVALPIPRSLSTVNFGVEVGKTGTTASSLIQENFVKFTLGIDIWERWFIKRKYN
jgi:hypothetical protein